MYVGLPGCVSYRLTVHMCNVLALSPPSSPGILHGGDVLLSRFRRDPRQMEEDEEAWFDEEEEITAIHSDPFTSSPTLSLSPIPLPTFSNTSTSTSPPVTVSTTSSPPHPPIPRCPSYTNLLAPSSSSSSSSTAPSPFTQVSYSPRPASALTRTPLLESAIKAPIVTQVHLYVYWNTYGAEERVLFIEVSFV